MRTYEEVKAARKKYHDALVEEAGSRHPHFVITGGNMCVIKKGAAQYILGKGEPIPMREDTAQGKLVFFQEKCGDNIKLEVISYSDWLKANIEECDHLISCIQKSLSGEEEIPEEPMPVENVEETPVIEAPAQPEPPTVANGDWEANSIEMSCPGCPLGIKMCMVCRFCVGVKTDIYPWQVVCSAPKPKNS